MPAHSRDLPVWTLAAASLGAGVPVALLCVVRSEGSSPGRQGFKMAVTANAIAGSIGGGIMEHKWVELARQRLLNAEVTPLLRPQIHRREAPADRSGMMCSGEQEVLLLPLTTLDLFTVMAIEQALQTHSPGAFELSAAGLRQTSPAGFSGFYDYAPGPSWRYRERLGLRDQLTLVGGGHVSLALSRVLAQLDFELTVLDDRADLPTLDANIYAHHRRRISYDNILVEIPENPHQYVVVMTVGYRSDALVLRQLLGRPCRYLGVMGSAAKLAELRRVLREAGFAEEALERLRGPIGVAINSRTPEEIAISVAAELIGVRNLMVNGEW
ncbi:XdhC family protein [Hymenobacter sp. ASUV-10]|uniref:XdhC family protein n=1 Tax=Hymenobacter aranciens TaxID=3063996 RepID=A0ABT9BAQ3_9BACT|nr:XdhC/CoxI family protein [Hymenobacter sp. ASUV-10]MDO7874107.1 XdhC family protein [Hymenobacter sp. ASUV-10]